VGARLTTGRVALIALIAVIGTRLLLAPYWVWEDEHQARVAAEAHLEAFTQRNADIRAHLQQFYVSSDLLLRKIVAMPKNISDDEYNKYQQDLDSWSNDLEKYMNGVLGPLFVSRLLDISNVPPIAPDPTYGAHAKDRAATMSAIVIQRHNLLQIIDGLK
jgi:hypothetical protein